MSGSLIIFLHAHLPYVNHPEHEYSLEENWLFEAAIETYIPLLDMLDTMAEEGLAPHLTLSLSPSLTEMFNSPRLQKRLLRHMANLTALAEAEIKRTTNTAFEPVAELYLRRLKRVRLLYEERYGRDLTAAFRRLQDCGHIELLTTSATHAFLPAFAHHPETIRNQIKTGMESYRRNFGSDPAGFWLPECGYYKGLDILLKEAGVKYFFVESHGLLYGKPRPQFSVYRPILTSSGLTVFGRDTRSARQVWCASSGYPGDPCYRDFYRDIGFDLPEDYVGAFTHLKGIRTFTGLKYYRITGKTPEKLAYDPTTAVKKASEHAAHFLKDRELDFDRMAGRCPEPLIFSAFDAELFGHWWFEGVDWLDAVIRKTAESDSLKIVTAKEYLNRQSVPPEIVEPSPSTWGEGGHGGTWISENNYHIYGKLHRAAEQMESLVRNYGRLHNINPLIARAIRQAQRETFLSQASDWPFLIEKDRASGYAAGRIEAHIERFNRLYSMITDGSIDERELAQLEHSDGIFPWLDAGLR